MSTSSNKGHTDFPTIIQDTTFTADLMTKQLTGDTGRVYTIHIVNGQGADLFVALYDSDAPVAGAAQACLFRFDNGVNMTISSKTGIPISTGLSYNVGTSAAGTGTVNSSKAYIFGS